MDIKLQPSLRNQPYTVALCNDCYSRIFKFSSSNVVYIVIVRPGTNKRYGRDIMFEDSESLFTNVLACSEDRKVKLIDMIWSIQYRFASPIILTTSVFEH